MKSINKVNSFLNKNKFKIMLFLLIAVLYVDPSKTFASTIPTGSSDSIGSAISGIGNTIGGYATDSMYILFGVAGISLIIAGAGYMFSREHGKLVKDGLGITVVAGVLGTVMGAVSHGVAGAGTGGSTGAMILSHTVAYIHTHIAVHLNN